MEDILREYGNLLWRELELPGLERERKETRRQFLAAQREGNQKHLEWKQWETPSLAQRFFGKTEEKREAAYRAFREAEKKCAEAEFAWKNAEENYEAARADRERLSGAGTRFSQLKKEEIPPEKAETALRPVARYAAERTIESLERAMQWEQDAGASGHESKILECLAEARYTANELRFILTYFPEPDSWICDYLRNPDGFIHDGVIMKVSPRDKIRRAIGQMEKLKTKLQ